jgi:hypothetical protein
MLFYVMVQLGKGKVSAEKLAKDERCKTWKEVAATRGVSKSWPSDGDKDDDEEEEDEDRYVEGIDMEDVALEDAPLPDGVSPDAVALRGGLQGKGM